MSRQRVDLASLFRMSGAPAGDGSELPRDQGLARTHTHGEYAVVLDRFARTEAQCAALRISAAGGDQPTLGLTGGYKLQTVAAGGWLLSPVAGALDSYWIPQPPMLRRLDNAGHILSHRHSGCAEFDISASDLEIRFDPYAGHALDLVVWRLPVTEGDLPSSLQRLSSLEVQRYFLWSSHTVYARPADLYLHWVHGHVYENHEVWPKYWRVCSELDAYALYVVLTGLFRATGKEIYDLMRTQVVFSVIARQADDGGWYHGEWTDQMESHFRLHAAGMHLLAAHFEETRDPTVGTALAKAAAFAANGIDRLDSGAWYLHDSLEFSATALRSYPFPYVSSRALGKSESNLLVLNTHLDTNIAMARQRQVTGDERHRELIASASAATRAVLGLRTAEWLYRLLFRAIGLTFLSTERAKALPLPVRALKRVAWKYLVPALPWIKASLPRLVMPGGFIERALTVGGASVRYQPVNLMDLIRTRRTFDDASLDAIVTEAFAYTHDCGITARWKEFKGKEDDALGFWAEALYHLALARPDRYCREWLAQAMLDLEDNGLGLPPSLLGANAEAVAPALQRPCPNPVDARLRVANLSRGDTLEWLIVNPTDRAIALQWETAPAAEVAWQQPGAPADAGDARPQSVMPRSWLLGNGTHAARP